MLGGFTNEGICLFVSHTDFNVAGQRRVVAKVAVSTDDREFPCEWVGVQHRAIDCRELVAAVEGVDALNAAAEVGPFFLEELAGERHRPISVLIGNVLLQEI